MPPGFSSSRSINVEQGARRPVLRLLQRRFGPVPTAVRDDLSALDVDQIENLVDVALAAPTSNV